jgi:signal transduction histidine kinase
MESNTVDPSAASSPAAALPDDGQFFFADHHVLDDSPTRDFYRILMQGLVHKTNNMLGVIQGFSSLILMEDDLESGIKENVEQMRDSSINSSELNKIILIAGGCSRVSTEPMGLVPALPYIEQNARAICSAQGVNITFTARPDLPTINADSSRLNDIIAELTKNAAEAAADVAGGEVAIDVLPPGEVSPAEERRVDLFVRNTGNDIPADKIAKSFEAFHTTKDNSHYGIGLTTASVLAGQMDMRLGLRSAEGTTTVWLSIPVA